MVNIDKVAYKEVNFKSKLLEWTQKNRVRMEYQIQKESVDEKGSPVFSFLVKIEGVEGGKGQGYSKKEAQQVASKETLQRLRREPQFIDAIFQAKSERTKMEELPTMAAPSLESEKTDFIISSKKNPENPETSESPDNPESLAISDDDFDLSDITHLKSAPTREEIIAAAEAAAFLSEDVGHDPSDPS